MKHYEKGGEVSMGRGKRRALKILYRIARVCTTIDKPSILCEKGRGGGGAGFRDI